MTLILAVKSLEGIVFVYDTATYNKDVLEPTPSNKVQELQFGIAIGTSGNLLSHPQIKATWEQLYSEFRDVVKNSNGNLVRRLDEHIKYRKWRLPDGFLFLEDYSDVEEELLRRHQDLTGIVGGEDHLSYIFGIAVDGKQTILVNDDESDFGLRPVDSFGLGAGYTKNVRSWMSTLTYPDMTTPEAVENLKRVMLYAKETYPYTKCPLQGLGVGILRPEVYELVELS